MSNNHYYSFMAAASGSRVQTRIDPTLTRAKRRMLPRVFYPKRTEAIDLEQLVFSAGCLS